MLQQRYSNTLQCPCSKQVINHHLFVSISANLHQVCASDLVTDHWIDILRSSISSKLAIEWRNIIPGQIQLLSDLCRLAFQVVNETTSRFLTESFITANILPENDFNTLFNTILNQFYRSTETTFGLVIDTIHLQMRIDQPHMGSTQLIADLNRPDIPTNITIDPVNNITTIQVRSYRLCMNISFDSIIPNLHSHSDFE